MAERVELEAWRFQTGRLMGAYVATTAAQHNTAFVKP